MNRLKYLFSLLLGCMGIFLFSSCEKIISNPQVENVPSLLVINAILNPDSIFQVQVTRSISILDEPDNVVLDSTAQVVVLENDSIIDTLVFQPNKLLFISKKDQYPLTGKTYKIVVSSGNFPTAYAETYIPEPVKISKINIISDGLKVYFDDPLDVENYYLLESYYLYWQNIYNLNRISNIFDSTLVQFNTSNKIIELIGNYNLNHLDFNEVSSSGGVDLSGNFKISASQVVFNDITFNGKQFMFEFEDVSLIGYNGISVNLYSLSADYYKYIKSRAAYKNYDGFFTERVPIYTNVKNGYGIVIGYSKSSFRLNLSGR